MKKVNEVHKSSKEKKRCISVLPYKYHYKLLNNKKKIKSNNFFPSKTIDNFYTNNNVPKNKVFIFDSLINDIKKYKYLNQASKTSKINIKDIDIIKEQQNEKLISKISNFLEHKKDRVSLLNKLNEPKVENIKKRLYESKSEQNILAKTFSTKFISNDKYKQLVNAFEKGHGKKIGENLQYKGNKNDTNFRKNQSELYKTNKGMMIDPNGILNSFKISKSRNINISPKIIYYNNQYDSYNSLQINKNLYAQIVLNQEKEQIKQFLKKELLNEQKQFTYDLMPRIKTIELSKFKKEPKENNFINYVVIISRIVMHLLIPYLIYPKFLEKIFSILLNMFF